MSTTYSPEQPARETLEAAEGPAVVMFGTTWCGYCRAAERYVDPALAEHPDVPVHAVEDGRGRALGRSYRVKLWPTLIFLLDGVEVDRVVRPTGREAVDAALARIAAPGPQTGAAR
ncbi:thioredoxin family protein [Ornithinimicrobium avium]|uniref:Thioredoxin n=1 Tax=Ornithinimicrobium avium TaxID=2283195 RepID=A0A345NQH9_9MICO|nr:thioredoxin family protein [Ornithinimicrobium avium]AXH97287.1 thioredoxin [Ornithinimicrobium avium]